MKIPPKITNKFPHLSFLVYSPHREVRQRSEIHVEKNMKKYANEKSFLIVDTKL